MATPSPPSAAVPLQLSMKDVSRCRRNADRLRRDARGRSPGTKLALYEFALEELAKAHLILIVLQFSEILREGGRAASANRASVAAGSRMLELLRANSRFFEEKTIRRALQKDHDLKLDFVEFLGDIALVSIEDFESRRAPIAHLPARYRLTGAVVNLGPIRRLGLREMRATIGRLKARKVNSLDTLCKRAIFADLDPATGRLQGPEADLDLIRDLWLLLRALRIGVDIAERAHRKTGSTLSPPASP